MSSEMLFFLPNFRYYFEDFLDQRFPEIRWSFKNKVYWLTFDENPFLLFGGEGPEQVKTLAVEAVLLSLKKPVYFPPKFARRILDTPDHDTLATLRTTLQPTPQTTPQPEKNWFRVIQLDGQSQGVRFLLEIHVRGIEQTVIAVRIERDFNQAKTILSSMVRQARRDGVVEITVSVRSLANLLRETTEEDFTKERAGAVLAYMLKENYAKANGNWRSRGSDLIFAKFD